MSAHAFDFEIPEKESDWFKYDEGEQKLRVLSEPIKGWEEWQESGQKRTPVRYHYADKPESPINSDKPVKLFLSMIVWNYTKKKIEILHCDKMSIIKELKKLAEDADWGSLYEYDIRIKREGQKEQTRYTVTPLPQKPLEISIRTAFKAKPIDLQEIFSNGDPFKPLGMPMPMALESPSQAPQSKNRNEDLRAVLDGSECDSTRLEDYLQHHATAKKVAINKIVDSCLLLPVATLVANFNAWVVKNPVDDLPF